MSYNCSDPTSLSNGYYVIAQTYYTNGDKLFYICYSGYTLQGNPTITCDGSTGNWTGSIPICSSTTTTTTAAPDTYEEWFYLGLGLVIFLGVLLLLLLLYFCFRICSRLCRRTIRVNAFHGYEETDTGCCYLCCKRCCRSCCKCCFPENNVEPIKQSTNKNITSKQSTGIQTAIPYNPPSSTLSVVSGSHIAPVYREPPKPAKEMNMWRPHKHPVRNINTSTQ